jgi:flagellar basal-body rod modification protein FlgD
MDVTSTTGMSSAAAASAPKANTSAGSMGDYNTFLQLLIAQAKNQDPTNPTDPSQYVQQFAALSQVEQSVTTNAKLDQIISGIEALRPTTSQSDAP